MDSNLKIVLSQEETLITHSSNKVRFLGYDVSVRRNAEIRKKFNGVKARTLSGIVNLSVPFEKIEKMMFQKGIITQKRAKKFKPIHRKDWLYLPDYEIIERYNAEIRGILNFYILASDFYNLSYFAYLMEYSCYATLAGKYDSSISKIIRKYKRGKDFVIKYKTSSGKSSEKTILKFKDFKLSKEYPVKDQVVNFKRTAKFNGAIIARLQGNIYELCGSKNEVNCEIHHVPSIKRLDDNTLWKQIMKKKHRNTLVVCQNCHSEIHSGNN